MRRLVIGLCSLLSATALAQEQSQKGRCESGDGAACFVYSMQLEQAGHLEEAFAAIRRACELKQAGTCNRLAMYYREGKGTAKDLPRAYALSSEGCEAKDVSGCYAAAEMAEKGEGVRKDLAAAERFRARAKTMLDAMHDEATAREREKLRKDPSSFREAERKCMSGNTDLDAFQCHTATYLYDQTDPVRTLQLLDRACQIAPNLCEAGGVLLEQRHLDELALQFFEQQCDKGSADTCATWGVRFDGKHGTPADPARQLAILDRACTMGSSYGCRELAKLKPDAATKRRAAAATAEQERRMVADGMQRCLNGAVGSCMLVERMSKDPAERARAKAVIDADKEKQRADAQQGLDGDAAVQPWVDRLAQIVEESRAQGAERVAGDRLSAAELQQLRRPGPTMPSGPLARMQDPQVIADDVSGGQAWVQRRAARLAEIRQLLEAVRPILEPPPPASRYGAPPPLH